MKNVIVTGAIGYIGSNLVRQLYSQGYGVIHIDKKIGSDILNSPYFEDMYYPLDCIVHLAAVSSIEDCKNDPEQAFKDNITATKIISDSEIDYVKTETGVGIPGKPEMHEVYLVLQTLKELKTDCKLKATSGRVTDVYAFISAGASIIGTRNGSVVVDALPIMQKLFK